MEYGMTETGDSMISSDGVEAKAPAKINLFLLVGARRTDGYHPVCSLMEKVGLFDRLVVRRTGREGVRILGSTIPAPSNTVFRAAAALEAETGAAFDIEVTLEKMIPEAAGLAGGSSDAAAMLKLLAEMYGLEVTEARMAEIAVSIGADVPFFLQPGPLLAEGAGELLSGMADLPWYHAVIIKPASGLATAEVYELYDSVAEAEAASFPDRRRQLLERLHPAGISFDRLAALLANDLEAPATRLCPEIGRIKDELLSLGAAGALMSGSGPSVFGLFAGKNDAVTALREMQRRGHRQAWIVAPQRKPD